MSTLSKLVNRRNGLIVVGLVLAGAAVLHFMGGEKKPEYKTATITRGDIEVLISASGTLQPKDYVEVGAQVSGELKSFNFDIGDHVEKGQLIAEIDETRAVASVNADKAQLKELKASYAQQQATLELSQADKERAEMLYSADAISKAEYQAAVADLKVAKARLDQLEAQIERVQSTLDGDLATLSYTKIYAPMSGTIVSQAAVVGQTLNANMTTPTVLTIADLSVMTVEADVSEADVLRVKKGQEAYFTTLGDTEKKWTTSVRQVLPEPEVVNDVVLFKALLDVENKDELLKPDMTAQVFFIVGKADNAILAPVAALRDAPERPAGGRRPTQDNEKIAEGRRASSESQSFMSARAAEPANADDPRRAAFEGMRKAMEEHPDATRKMVLLMVNGEPRPRPVLIGLSNRSNAEVLYGLKEGDVVVTGEISPSAIKRPKNNDRTRNGRARGAFMGRPPGR